MTTTVATAQIISGIGRLMLTLIVEKCLYRLNSFNLRIETVCCGDNLIDNQLVQPASERKYYM